MSCGMNVSVADLVHDACRSVLGKRPLLVKMEDEPVITDKRRNVNFIELKLHQGLKFRAG